MSLVHQFNFHLRKTARQVSLLILSIFFNTCLPLWAQKPANDNTITPVAKFKPPKVNSYLGPLSGFSATCNVDQGRQFIRMPLRIEDERKNTYRVTSYQFGYTRVGVVEDEKTGKFLPQSDMVSGRFTSSLLPELWIKTISETLHKGEQFYFFDIICADKQGRMFFAPELRINIQ